MCSRSASGTDAGERNTCKGGADTESRDLTREVLRSTGEAGIGYSSPWGARTWLEKAKKKKCKRAKWLSEEATQIAEKREEAKGKGEK